MLIVCNLDTLSLFMRILFSRTKVYDVMNVIDSLSTFESWIKEVRSSGLRFPVSFDIDFFCSAVQAIIDTDHHQTLIKMLSLIYNFAELFDGEARRILFGEFLIKKHFFSLFLHWDDTVRNSFQQLMVYKVLRVKRSTLHSQGNLHIRELSGKDVPSLMNDQDVVAPDLLLDSILFSKLETYVKMVQEQLRDTSFYAYPKPLEVYAPQALSDYKVYLSRYYQWENNPTGESPKLMPLHLIHSANGDSL